MAKKQQKLKFNGRPMLFAQDWTTIPRFGSKRCTRLRIVYPDGNVEYYIEEQDSPTSLVWHQGCTSRPTQRAAVRACRAYFRKKLSPGPFRFLGYL